MSISLIQSRGGSSTGTNTVTLAYSSNNTSGNLLIVDVDWGAGGVTGDYTFSDTLGSTWTKHPNGPIITVTVANNGNHTLRIGIYEYNSTTGWQATPFDVGNSSTQGNATTANPGTITPAAAGELVHANMQWTSAVSAITCTSPYTEQPAGGTAGWISDGRADSGDNQNCASGSQTCTFNWTTTASSSSLIAAFKPAAGGGGGNPIDDDSYNVNTLLIQQAEPVICVW
jgi:hypothetical protein